MCLKMGKKKKKRKNPGQFEMGNFDDKPLDGMAYDSDSLEQKRGQAEVFSSVQQKGSTSTHLVSN